LLLFLRKKKISFLCHGINAPVTPQGPDFDASALPTRIGDCLQYWEAEQPDRLALTERSGSWTYGELAAAVRAAAAWLSSQGIRPGDRVMVVAENCRKAAAVLLAVAELDAWPVVVNGRLAPAEIAAIRAHCQPRQLLVAADAIPATRTLAAQCGADPVLVEGVGELFAAPADAGAAAEALADDASQRVGAVIYTSGSTGTPKGVMLSHRNLLHVAGTAAAIRRVTSADRFYAVMPLSHSVGLSSVLLCALMQGASVQMTQRFNPAEAIRSFQQDGITILLGTPPLYKLMLDYAAAKDMKRLNAPALRIISASGAPLDQTVKQATEQFFGLDLHHGYGITECGPTIAQVRPQSPRRDLSVGQLLPGMEARLDDEIDGIGELHVRGPNVMLGYYRDPAGTAAAVDAQGWYRTGDLARWDGAHLFIVGRRKELIIRHGYNVLPAEVEAVLNAHPDVVQSAVVGRTVGGDEEVVAHVQARAGSTLTEKDLLQHAAAQLASYKRPSAIRLVETMPMLPSGKVDKRRLT
jgi:acyl-CoA synthetase (AMP-forming)/AMP-acid ligase II